MPLLLDETRWPGATGKAAGLRVGEPLPAKPGSTTGIPERGQRGDAVGTTRGRHPALLAHGGQRAGT